MFRVIIRDRAALDLELGLGLMFDPNNLLTLTIATKLTLTVGTRWNFFFANRPALALIGRVIPSY